MRKQRQLLIAALVSALTAGFAVAQGPTVKTFATDPVYPTTDQPVKIYVNVLAEDIVQGGGELDTANTITAYTGTITTASSDVTDSWRNVKNADWNDLSVVMTRENDSIYSLTIDDIAAFYNVPANEDVIRITFIARGTDGTSVKGQTRNIYIEVYGSEPASVFNYQPATPNDKQLIAVTWNTHDTIGGDKSNHLFTYTDTTYVHTWLNGLNGPAVGSGNWPDNMDKFRCIDVNDSIKRWFIMPTTRGFYQFKPWSKAESIGMLIRSKDGSKQTRDFSIPLISEYDIDFSQINPVMMYPPYPTKTDEINIFIDAKNYKRKNGDQLDPSSTLSAWSGIISSKSTSLADWKNQVNAEWSGFGDSTLFDRVNDSIHVWKIPRIASKYNVDVNAEEPYRIALIARDTLNNAVNKQTDDLFFDVFNGTPSVIMDVQPKTLSKRFATAPVVITLYTKDTVTVEGNDLWDYTDTVAVHTGLITSESSNSGDWKFASEWGTNTSKYLTTKVNDTIYRYFIFPDAHTFYGTRKETNIDSIAIIFRSKNTALGKQTSNLYIAMKDTVTVVVKPDATINPAGGLSIKVYPNPARDIINFDLGEAKTAEIRIYTIQGREVFIQKVEGQSVISLNVAEISSGSNLLIYRIITESETTQGQLILTK